jgi:hypothetical protein
MRSQTICTSPLLLAENNASPLGEKERKLQPKGALNVANGCGEVADDVGTVVPSFSTSKIEIS